MKVFIIKYLKLRYIYIYVIYRMAGLYWINILSRSEKRPGAEGRGRPRQNILNISHNNHKINIYLLTNSRDLKIITVKCQLF